MKPETTSPDKELKKGNGDEKIDLRFHPESAWMCFLICDNEDDWTLQSTFCSGSMATVLQSHALPWSEYSQGRHTTLKSQKLSFLLDLLNQLNIGSLGLLGFRLETPVAHSLPGVLASRIKIKGLSEQGSKPSSNSYTKNLSNFYLDQGWFLTDPESQANPLFPY